MQVSEAGISLLGNAHTWYLDLYFAFHDGSSGDGLWGGGVSEGLLVQRAVEATYLM